MNSRFATTLIAWMCVLLIGAAAMLRPGLVLCVSEHGHVALEASCGAACEAVCTDSCDQERGHDRAIDGTDGGCRDLPVESDLTSLQQREGKVAGSFAVSDLPVSILELPLAIASGDAAKSAPLDVAPRVPAQLCALRVTIIQV